jgi:DNA sulfur modification protein DndB
MKGKLIVPSLTGKFATWRYYQFILRVEDFAKNIGSSEKPEYRIKSVDEVEEIYSKTGVSNLLQRAYNPKRLDSIKNYILNQPDRYLNNLTIGIFGGDPVWVDIAITSSDDDVPELEIKNISSKFGLISLGGEETLFVLDGQHRLKGLRSAYAADSNKVKNDEMVCTLIVHNPSEEGRQKTRRLFSSINRQAVPVSKGENILLDEDDVSAIVTRAVIEECPEFKDKKIIALSKTGNIGKSKEEQMCLTNVVTLWTINEVLIPHKEIYPKIDGKLIRIRPTESSIIDKQAQRIFKCWELFFEVFPEAKKFVTDSEENRINYRKEGGGIYLRPIIQVAFFEILSKLQLQKNKNFEALKILPTEVSAEFWHHIAWNPSKNTMLFNRGLVRNYMKFHIGLSLTAAERHMLKSNYKKNSGGIEIQLNKPFGLKEMT